jgi:hypothetical protein
VIEHLHGKITEILDESLIVALVPDIWENNLIHRLGQQQNLSLININLINTKSEVFK